MSKCVIVAGDMPLTWRVLRDGNREEGQATSPSPTHVRVQCQPNGWRLLWEVLSKALPPETDLRCPVLPPDRLALDAPEFHHSFTMWSLYKVGKKVGQTEAVYRMEAKLGWGREAPSNTSIHPKARVYHQVRDDPARADIVVLDDWGLGYRSAQHLWPLSVQRSGREGAVSSWVIVKMSHPLFEENPLCKDLIRSALRDRVIFVVSANDLRRMDVELSREMSWDQAAFEVLTALKHHPDMRYFRQAAATVFSFEDGGAMFVSESPKFVGGAGTPNGVLGKGDSDLRACVRLFFRPRVTEWTQGGRVRGRVPGHLKCLTTALAVQFAHLDPQAGDEECLRALSDGVRAGLSAGRLLFEWGYGDEHSFESGKIGFPTDKVAEVIRPPVSTPASATKEKWDEWKVAKFTRPLASLIAVKADEWSILENTEDIERLPERIVRYGIDEALKDYAVPVGTFNKLTTLDRQEIQRYRSIRRLLDEYCRKMQRKPLSIAVFGPPGSGKSFAVRELAQDLELPDSRKIDFLGFNLSQFSHPHDLRGALHQIRDAGLSGNLPLVFWDEFDCSLGGTKLGWLRYFLAPMEDGQFQDGQITHPIGAAVFVFAGGTAHTFEQFKSNEKKTPATTRAKSVALASVKQTPSPGEAVFGKESDSEPDAISPPLVVQNDEPAESNDEGRHSGKQAANAKWTDVKGPDFVSRLKGTLDIPGINWSPGASDPVRNRCIIRRAILLRSCLETGAPQLVRNGVLEIDEGVLRGLLHTSLYRHGVRSLKAVLEMSLLAGRQKFERSCLPDDSQLELHVSSNDLKRRINNADRE